MIKIEQQTKGIDFKGHDWREIRRVFEERRRLALLALATPRLDQREGDMLRGELKLCDAVLDLDEEKPNIPSDIYR
jgi:hypothetical protein